MNCDRFVLCLLLLALSFPAHANRDIVYAARYYYPPGSRGTSHFHLYRINPNGFERTQLTFGKSDNDNPQWSPDRRWILFKRTTRQHFQDLIVLCLLNARTGKIRQIKTGNFDTASWSPNGRTIAVTHTDWDKGGWACSTTLIGIGIGEARRLRGATGVAWSPDNERVCAHDFNHDEIVDLRTGHTTRLPSQGAVWLNNSSLVSIQSRGRNVFLITERADGHPVRQAVCRWLQDPYERKHVDSTVDPYLDSINPGRHTLLPIVGGPRPFLYVQDVGESGNRPCNAYYNVNPRTGLLSLITGGQFFCWGGGGQFYCTAPARSGMDYGKMIDGYQKSLDVASLTIGSVKTRKEQDIVSGLVWVTGADWRCSIR